MESFQILATLNLVLGGMVFLLGLVILRENPWQRLNRVVACMLFFGGMGSILAALNFLVPEASMAAQPGSSWRPRFLEEFDYLWEFFFPILFLFASYFPRERAFTRRFRNFDLLVLAPHAFHFLLLLTFTAILPSTFFQDLQVPNVIQPIVTIVELMFGFFLAIHRALFSLVNLGYGMASAGLLLFAYGQARAPRLREQLRVIGAGLTACLILYSFASSIPVLFDFHVTNWARSLLTISALISGSGAIAYSMVRYKFLDTKLLARRGILYALASAVAVGLYLTVILRLNRFLAGVTHVDSRVFEPVSLVIGLILFQPAIARLEERLERFFLRDPGDYRNVLRNLARELLTRIDLEEMMSRSIGTLAETLLLRTASAVALSREGPLVRVGAGPFPAENDVALLPGILNRLSVQKESLRLDDPLEPIDALDRAVLIHRFGAVLVFPLRTQGETVGALLLGEKETGTGYTSEDVSLLSDLARQMSVSVQNGLLLRERVAVVRLEEEMNLARRIQKTFLPSEFPRMERFEVHGVNTPSRQVGGDYFDLVPAGDGSFFLAIADVAGKGVPAALLTSMLQASLRTQIETQTSVSSILHGMNALVHSRTASEQFATFFLARVEEEGLRMSFSNAGHNYPVLCRRSGEVSPLVRGGFMLGMFGDARFEEDALDLRPGDRVVLYTDGVSEATNAAGDDYGEERIWRQVQSFPGHFSAREMTEAILEDLYRFLDGEEPQDDLTLMVLRVLEPLTTPATRAVESLSARGR